MISQSYADGHRLFLKQKVGLGQIRILKQKYAEPRNKLNEPTLPS